MTNDCWPTADQTLLLQAALLEGEVGRRALERWRTNVVLDRLDRGSTRLLPLLYQQLLAAGTDDPLLPRLKDAYDRAAVQNHELMEMAADAIRALQASGIDSVVLKGMGLIVRGVVAPGARPMSDCDLLVPESQAIAAGETLRRAGWSLDECLNANLLSVRHAVRFSSPSGHGLDLHWHALADCCEAGADMDFWKAAEPATLNGVATHTLCAADVVLHVCVHGLRWSIVPPVRWAADALAVIRSADPHVDWERLVDQTERRMLSLPMIVTLRYLRDTLDAPVPDRVLHRVSQIPVSRRARAEHRVKMQRRTLPRQLVFHWLQHRRLQSTGTLMEDLVRFPAYARRLWESR
jgi:hypothetical protein